MALYYACRCWRDGERCDVMVDGGEVAGAREALRVAGEVCGSDSCICVASVG